jgi:EAL domain-containing protein (putative c-di-GMP-specific phosphodiesterase class I)
MSSQCDAVSDFLRNADLAMYRAKKSGPGNSCFFSDQLAQEAALRLELESDLRPAIEADEFEIFFQPIICTREGASARAEVLVRWRHPKRGLLSPGQFLDIIDETGMSAMLTERVLNKACNISKKWSDEGRRVELSVNIPPQLFMEPGFSSELDSLLSETGADPHLLNLELLETHSISDVARLNEQLRRTHGLGVRVYMDDFGSGYSSLSYLAELDIDGFKMDRRFLRDLLNEDRAVKAYEAIMYLANSLNLRVVAEGVEHGSEFEILKRAGCEWYQGFLFSRPLCLEDFEKFSFVQSEPPTSWSDAETN